MIVGRERQVQELAALAAAITSGARVAWLVGPEGVGKSTLARAASALAGLPVHRLDVYPEDRDRPLSGVDDLAHALGIELGDEPASSLLDGLAAAGPSCLVIEDAQWMDEASQVTLWRVIRRLRRLPVFLIVTSADEPGPLFDGLNLLLRSPEAGRILPIGPFSEAEAAEYLRRELGMPTTGDTLARVLAATEGYPAMLSSLVDQVRLSGRSTDLLSVLRRLATTTHRSGLVRQHVAAAWKTASPADRAALLALAQAGDLDGPRLAQVLHLRGLPDTGIGRILATGLVVRSGPQSLRLRHHCAAEVLDRAPWTEATASHAALAQVLTGLDALQHRVATADPDTTPGLLAELYDRLAEAYAHRDVGLAFRLARYAARLDPAALIEVVLVPLRAGRPGMLGDIAHELTALQPGVARAAVDILMNIDRLGPAVAAEQLNRIDTARIEDSRELVLLAHTAVYITLQGVLSGRPGVGERFHPLIETLHGRSGYVRPNALLAAPELLLTAHGVEALIVHAFNHELTPRERIARLRDLGDEMAGDPRLEPVMPLVGCLIGGLQYLTGDLGAARASLEEVGLPDLAALRIQARLTLASVAFHDGDWGRARTLADQELAVSLDALQPTLWQQVFALAALVPAGRGEEDVIEEYLGWQRTGSVRTVADAHRNIALAWSRVASSGTDAEVALLLDQVWQAGQVAFTGCFPTAVLRVGAHLAAGNRPAAEAARAALSTTDYEPEAARYILAHTDALLAADADDPRTPELFAAALDGLDAQCAAQPGGTLRLFSAVLAEDWAHACDAAGRPRPAELDDLLVATVDLLERNGADAWSGRLRGLVVGSSARSRRDARLAALTAREREVALLAAQGLTNKQIAALLFVTVRTAEYHVHNALTKLGMASRVDLRDAFGTTGRPDASGPTEPPRDAAAADQPGTSAIVNESLPTA